ncbi:MAG: NADH:ubiquinone oxidoreductase subunit J [Coxiella sp. RIFCSPHIGHO2_12_FULL_42_15]|nr:MAG: NADH:ubiquinone oxidoreductase subunit J [Coxiella sp. RIFCSPHIGHO2_12_FULL_42_15]
MVFPIYPVIFYVFAVILVTAATLVITARNPVRSILFLVLAFVASAVLWMLIQAEFLALVLIFVYVGAVMTLFLFVVMMLNIDLSYLKEKFVRYLPLGLVAMILLVVFMVVAVSPRHLGVAHQTLLHFGSDYNNTQSMGTLLYTDYILPFEIAGLILLVAIVAAITLAFHGRKPGTKSQHLNEQHKAQKQTRLRLVKMKAEKS